MSINIVATVFVVEKPERYETTAEQPTMVAFPIADGGIGTYSGQSLTLERLLIGEVVCRGALAERALAVVTAGTIIGVSGVLLLRAPLDYHRDDTPFVSIILEANELIVA